MGMVSSKTELPEYKKINVVKIERHLKACLTMKYMNAQELGEKLRYCLRYKQIIAFCATCDKETYHTVAVFNI